jgi:hypothetical protein
MSTYDSEPFYSDQAKCRQFRDHELEHRAIYDAGCQSVTKLKKRLASAAQRSMITRCRLNAESAENKACTVITNG